MKQTERHRRMRADIVDNILPDVIKNFLLKNEDYGVGSDEFGAKAQVIDISRKYKKVKAAIWDGEELEGEPLEEVIGDMIGHCLLLLEELRPTCTQPYDPMEFTAHDWWCTYVEAMSEWQDEEAPSDG